MSVAEEPPLSSLEKVLWPEAGFTKGQMVDYYRRVAPVLLPHLAARPLVLGRFPAGVERPGFAQTECRGAPDWLRTAPIRLRGGAVRRFCVVEDLRSLLWVANQNAIELHPLPVRIDRPDRPVAVVLDLDPAPPADLLTCCEVALHVCELLAARELDAVVKSSGSVGLHVYVPLDGRATFGQAKAFARELAAHLAAELPARVTDEQRGPARAGRVLVDWLQNDPMRSTVAPYSLRSTPWPTVSTPLRWEELAAALEERRPELLVFLPDDVLERAERIGDPFRPAFELEQSL